MITLDATPQLHRTIAVGSMPDDSWINPQDIPADLITISENARNNPNGLDLALTLVPVDANGDPVALPARTVRIELHEVLAHASGVDVIAAGERSDPIGCYESIPFCCIGAGRFAIRVATSTGSAGTATHVQIWVRSL